MEQSGQTAAERRETLRATLAARRAALRNQPVSGVSSKESGSPEAGSGTAVVQPESAASVQYPALSRTVEPGVRRQGASLSRPIEAPVGDRITQSLNPQSEPKTEADQPKRELVPATPSSLQVKDNEASVAAFLDYLEAFYESFEDVIESDENITWSSIKEFVMDMQYEGQYRFRWDSFFDGMGYLIKLLYETMRIGIETKQGAKTLTEEQCRLLFDSIAFHAGFRITLLVNFDDYSSYSKDFDLTAYDSYTRLIDFNKPLREQDWNTLRSRAIERIVYLDEDTYQGHERTKYSRYGVYYRNWSVLDRYFRAFDRYDPHFSYHRAFAPRSEIKNIVSEIIDGEVIRFRRFLEAFHGTLQFLAVARPLARTKVKPPRFDQDNINEALDIFKNTIHLLRTVANKQEVTPQKSATTLVVSKVTPPTKVMLQVRKEEHTGNLHTYHLTLTDSKHLSEPVQFLLQVSESGEAELFEDDNEG